MSIEVEARIGIVGGSGIEHIEGLNNVRELGNIKTPFGEPSDTFRIGEIDGVSVAFLNRHGRGHAIPPHQLPNRPNIYGFKMLGVERLVSVSAVGSLEEQVEPGNLIIPDQLLDETKGRDSTFFENGITAHVSMANPFCEDLRKKLTLSARRTGSTVHDGGTLVVMQGPQFSTRAMSERYRNWNARAIGMTALPEAYLAREAGICYATLALSTDYDCWRVNEEVVSMDMIGQTMAANTKRAADTLEVLVPILGKAKRICECMHALDMAMVTNPVVLNSQALRRYNNALESVKIFLPPQEGTFEE